MARIRCRSNFPSFPECASAHSDKRPGACDIACTAPGLRAGYWDASLRERQDAGAIAAGDPSGKPMSSASCRRISDGRRAGDTKDAGSAFRCHPRPALPHSQGERCRRIDFIEGMRFRRLATAEEVNPTPQRSSNQGAVNRFLTGGPAATILCDILVSRCI